MSKHVHEWAVDAACDGCGLMISEHAQDQADQIAALETENAELRKRLDVSR